MFIEEREKSRGYSFVSKGIVRLYRQFLKRLLDFLVAAALIVLLSPIMLVTAALIYIRDPGSVIFAHWRVGQNGKEFPCLKFRSMVQNADEFLEQMLLEDSELRAEWEANQKLENDPRIIPGIGSFIRKFSLDELPQLINVLVGDMSLVGPRPCTSSELATHYGTDARYYKMVRPGVSGLWQVSGRSTTTFEERVLIDVQYVQNQNMALDLWIAARTPRAVISSRGAC